MRNKYLFTVVLSAENNPLYCSHSSFFDCGLAAVVTTGIKWLGAAFPPIFLNDGMGAKILNNFVASKPTDNNKHASFCTQGSILSRIFSGESSSTKSFPRYAEDIRAKCLVLEYAFGDFACSTLEGAGATIAFAMPTKILRGYLGHHYVLSNRKTRYKLCTGLLSFQAPHYFSRIGA